MEKTVDLFFVTENQGDIKKKSYEILQKSDK